MQTKILHIVRHGKALQDYRSLRDFDRPLIEKGIVNNEAVAKQLYAKYPTPDLIISSHAARALHTAHIFARVMGYPHNRVQVDESLYMEGENAIHNIIKSLSDEIESVMIVGHNPNVTYLANTYAGRMIGHISTSGVITICFETDRWSQIDMVKTQCNIIES